MTESELFRWVLIEGAIGGAVLVLIAWLLSRFTKDIPLWDFLHYIGPGQFAVGIHNCLPQL